VKSCPTHPEAPATSTCNACNRAFCESCLTYDVDGNDTCESCGTVQDERSRALGSALLTLVGVGYLAALALGYVLFRGRPFVGGFSAVIAIALGRTLQTHVRLPVVTRRSSEPHTG